MEVRSTCNMLQVSALGMTGLLKSCFVLVVAVTAYHVIQHNSVNLGEIRNKRVLITGASQNIGEELAYQFCKLGARVFITARRQDRLQQVSEKCLELGASEAHYLTADMKNYATEGNRVVNDAVEKLGGLDYVVLNHVYATPHRQLWNGTDEDMDYLQKSIEINYLSYVFMSTFASWHLHASLGRLIVVSSASGQFPVPRMATYGTTKAALNHFFNSMRVERHALPAAHHHIAAGFSITLCHLGYIETNNARWRQTKADVKGHPMVDTAKEILLAGAQRDSHVYIPGWLRWAAMMRRLLWNDFADRIFVAHT